MCGWAVGSGQWAVVGSSSQCRTPPRRCLSPHPASNLGQRGSGYLPTSHSLQYRPQCHQLIPSIRPWLIASAMSLLQSLLVFCLLLLSPTAVLAAPDVVFTLNSDNTATIRVNGATWLRTSATWFTAGGKTYSSADKTLALTSSDSTSGVDVLGRYNGTVLAWQAADQSSLRWMTIYRTYFNRDYPLILFDQLWVSGATDTSVGDSDGVLSSFPSFIPNRTATTLGALQWAGAFNPNHEFMWSGPNATTTLPLARGGEGGPLVLFDKRGRMAVTLSPFSSFMSTSLAASSDNIAQFGVVGSMQSVPVGHMVTTIAIFGDDGVTNTVLAWGDALLAQYGKKRQAAWEEHTTRYLGYATDNGAYYYVRPHTAQPPPITAPTPLLTRCCPLLLYGACISTTPRMARTTRTRCWTCLLTLCVRAFRTVTCCWTRGGTTRASWAE